MFEVGFTEILLLAVVALLVLGPQQLPGAVRSTASMIARLKRAVGDVRSELERELDADEIRRQIHNDEVMRALKDGRDGVRDLSRLPYDVKDTLKQAGSTADKPND